MINSTKPINIQLIQRVVEIFILSQCAFIFLSVWLVDHVPTSSFGVGFRNEFISRFDSYSYDKAGEITANLLISVVLILPFLISIYLRNKIILCIAQVCLIILVIHYIHLESKPYLPLLFIIISLLKPFRRNFSWRKRSLKHLNKAQINE